MEEEKGICPILSKHADAGFCSCQKEACAWYEPELKKCSVLVIAKELEEHAVEVLREI